MTTPQNAPGMGGLKGLRFFPALATLLILVFGFGAPAFAIADDRQSHTYSIEAQDLGSALKSFAFQSHREIFFAPDLTQGKQSHGVQGKYEDLSALDKILRDTGLTYTVTASKAILIRDPALQTKPIAYSSLRSYGTAAGGQEPAQVAQAENSPPPENQSSPTSNEGTEHKAGLEEIVVTAQKREQSIQDVPVSISVLSGELLSKMSVGNFAGIADSVPGLAFATTGVGNSQYFIRGIGQVGAGQSPTTGVYLDEVPLQTHTVRNASQPDPQVFDVSRIEVLRGPQGVLFGSAAMGGTIRIVTNPADSKHFQSNVEGSVSTIQDGSQSYDAKAMVNLPLANDKVGLRLVGVSGFQGGWIDDLRPVTGNLTENLTNPGAIQRDSNTAHYSMGRISLLLAPSDTLSITPSFLYQTTNSDTDRNHTDVTFGLRSRLKARYQPVFDSDKFGIGNLLVKKELDAWGGLSILSSSSYLDRDTDSNADSSPFRTGQVEAIVGPTPNGQLYWSAVRDISLTKQFTQEFRAVSQSDSALQYLFGLYYKTLDQDAHRTRPTLNLFGARAPLPFGASNPPVLEQIDSNFKENESALFGEVSYAFTNQWKLSLGGREFRYDQTDYRRRYGAGGLAGGDLTYQFTETNAETGFSPRAVVSYEPTKSINLYTSYSTGFRTGGINAPITNDVCTAAQRAAQGIPDVPPPYKSDKTINIEVGAKTVWLEGRLRVDGAVYSIDWKDYQQIVQAECGTNPVLYTANAGDVKSRGGEIELTMQATDHLNAAAGVSYTHAVYEKAFTTLGLPAGAAVLDVPRVTWNARVDYDFALSQSWQGDVIASTNFVDKTTSGFGEGEPLGRPSYVLTNVAVSLHKETLTWSLFVDNVTDTVPVYAQEFATSPTTTTATSYFAYIVGQPRTIGLRVRKMFR